MANAQLHRFGAVIKGVNGTISANNFALNQTTDQIEWIFEATEAATITRLGFRYGARALTPPTYKISLQGVDLATGFPDGTIKGGASPASKTFTPPADTSWDGTWQWITLDNSYACARGELLSIVISYASGTVDASNNSSFTHSFTVNVGYAVPYAITNDAGTRNKNNSGFAVFGYGSSTKAYGHPCKNLAGQSYSSASTPDEYALGFSLPATWLSSYQVVGLQFSLDPPAGSTFDIVLYSGTTVLQNATKDGDVNTVATVARQHEIYFDESSLSTLSAGTTYRASIAPSGVVLLPILEVDSAADFEAYEGGQLCFLSTRTDGGAWDADTLTKRPMIDLILADITAPSGGSVPPNTVRQGGI